MPKRSLAQMAFNASVDDFDFESPGLKRTRAAQMMAADVQESARVIDFSHYSRDVWYILNKKYASNRGSVEYERSRDATADVRNCVESIHRQATTRDSSFGTKKSALITLRKIGKSITMAPSTLGSEVHKQFQYEPCLQDAMKDILLGMTVEDIKAVAKSTDEKGTFVEKVDALQATATGLCIMEGLEEVMHILDDPVDAVLGYTTYGGATNNEPDSDIQEDGEPDEEGDGSDDEADGSEESHGPLEILAHPEVLSRLLTTPQDPAAMQGMWKYMIEDKQESQRVLREKDAEIQEQQLRIGELEMRLGEKEEVIERLDNRLRAEVGLQEGLRWEIETLRKSGRGIAG